MKPKILFFDIESCGVNALHADLGFLVVFGYKWAGDKTAHALLPTRDELRNFDDKRIVTEASKLFAEADIVVAHFGSVFDRRMLQGRLLIHKLEPIPPTKMRDTCMIARSVANFSSNRLKHLANILELRHKKTENGWPTSWFEVMKGNMKALGEMAEYCRHDVLALEELYYRLQPFDQPHPRVVEDKSKCATCGGKVQYRGFTFISERKYRRFQCTECGRWGRERKAVKI